MTVVLLVRHAITDATGKRLYGRSEGVHLSERGRQQAAALGRRLSALPIAGVHASPLDRCVETAEPIAAARGLPVQSIDGMLETDVGEWTGRTFASIGRTRLWRRIRSTPSAARFPGGESLADVQHRAVRAIEVLSERHPRGLVVVVSHGDPIRLVLAHSAGLHVDHFERLEVTPASVSAVAYGDGAPRVLRLNDTGTLEDLAPRRAGRR